MFTKIKNMFRLRNRLSHFAVDDEGRKAGFELVAFGATDKGLSRLDNEDSFLLLPLNDDNTEDVNLECLIAVADGLGRTKRGQIASRMAVDILRSSFVLPSVVSPMERLAAGIEMANREIFDKAEGDFSLKGMATTLTAVYVKDETVHVAHLGNSRAYLIRDGEMNRLTKDQTLAEVLKEIKENESVEISTSAYKTLLQAAGTGTSIEIWQTSFDLSPNDILLICSDGLTSSLSEEMVLEIVEKVESPETAVKQLIDEANRVGGEDNITAVVAKFRPFQDKDIPFPV